MPTLPWLSMRKAVEVAEAVEVERRSSGSVERERPSIESLPPGVEEAPRERRPPLVNWRAVLVAVPLVEVAMVKSGMT